MRHEQASGSASAPSSSVTAPQRRSGKRAKHGGPTRGLRMLTMGGRREIATGRTREALRGLAELLHGQHRVDRLPTAVPGTRPA